MQPPQAMQLPQAIQPQPPQSIQPAQAIQSPQAMQPPPTLINPQFNPLVKKNIPNIILKFIFQLGPTHSTCDWICTSSNYHKIFLFVNFLL